MPSSQTSQRSRPEVAIPADPEPPHAALHDTKMQNDRRDRLSASMTPPPSSQVPGSPHIKTRTPSPIDMVSQISTPPPTVEAPAASQSLPDGSRADALSAHDIATATPEELKGLVADLQAALRAAKMSAAHHKLQYQMLVQESNAALERMMVEAQMTHCENQIIYSAGQARAAATPIVHATAQEGVIPIQKELYNRMVREIQLLGEANVALEGEVEEQEIYIKRQDREIASLSDKVTLMRELMRERTREGREPSSAHRRSSRAGTMPTSVFSTPLKSQAGNRESAQPFAALLQASEIASQDAARSLPGRSSGKKSHSRNTHSLSNIPATPQSARRHQDVYHTPQGRQQALRVPSTAPVARTSASHAPNVYNLAQLPVSSNRSRAASEGTVSASDNDEVDSEADTEIIEQDEDDEINQPQASRTASQLLRSQDEQMATRESFKGSGMLAPKVQASADRYRQTKLFGAIRKPNVDRGDDERPAKRARTDAAPIGLGIAGLMD